MKLINENTGLKINIDDKLVEELIEISNKYYPNEFGGFLVGFYSNNFKTLNITNTILPNKFKSTRNLFERDIKGIENQFQDFYKQSPKRYYVGEWHTHPDNLPIPSSTDLRAINSIVNYSKVVIKNPVFLIIGQNGKKIELGFYVPLKDKLYRYE